MQSIALPEGQRERERERELEKATPTRARLGLMCSEARSEWFDSGSKLISQFDRDRNRTEYRPLPRRRF
ncbi:hypothetical protein EVAR_40747_1 [Eumeta japonica]|uniref:Uncharacterized protein n=1 Tax=Eumeta variegata TaxID=151549 RepID=A0A4C1X3F4_EUMVA|nr:hypothetical protein EVAR_40747_1 [Eumeta japonica]